MKKLFVITTIMVLAMNGLAQQIHYHFSEVVESGQTLYFLKRDYAPQEVWVTYPCFRDYYANGDHITTYYYGYEKPVGDLVIPSTVTHNDTVYTITRVDFSAFYGCSGLTSIVFPNTLTFIGQRAFLECHGITGEVVIPDSVTIIGANAFFYCNHITSVVFGSNLSEIRDYSFAQCYSLQHISNLPETLTVLDDGAFARVPLCDTIVIPPLVTTIGEEAFAGCHIPSVVISEGVTTIERGAFTSCPIGALHIPSTLVSICTENNAFGEGAFHNCTQLQSITVDEANPVYDSRSNCNALIETATNTLLKGCKNTVIPNDIAIIGHNAFLSINELNAITIPNSVERLETCAFAGCNSLTTITLPSNVSYIGVGALSCCGLTSIVSKSPIPPTAFNSQWTYGYENSFMGVNRDIPIYVPAGTAEAYSVAPGWDYFNNFVETAGFSQENIQRPTAINTWTYVAEYGAELPFDKDITLEYDERGNLSYYYHTINYPTGGYYTWKWFSHDALNRLTYKQENYQEVEWAFSYRYYYTYDDSSNLLECLVKYHDRVMMYYTQDYVINSKDVYQYENGKKTRWDHFTDSILILQNYYLYDYSDDDTWSSETKYNANGQPVTKKEYTYSGDYQPLSQTVFNWSMGDWVNASLTEYEYSEGNLIEKRITNWTDGEISQQQRQLYDYDENGNCTQILFQIMVDGVYADRNRATYLYDENNLCTNANAERWNDTTWVLGGFPSGTYLFFDDIYADVNKAIGSIAGCTRAEVTDYVTTPNPNYIQTPPNLEGEWYYEIQNEDGTTTYQHLEYAADTTINNNKTKVIVRTNQIYDKDFQTEVTHEYVYEEDGVVYWWNKEMQEFTTLYDLNADTGDEWIINVGQESVTMHVDSVKYHEYNGLNYRTLSVSDDQGLFSGDIICCLGHLTSFFPEKLMNKSKDFKVDGLRCYWLNDELFFHNGTKDCDDIYLSFHNVSETPTDIFTVYPNPTTNLLHVIPSITKSRNPVIPNSPAPLIPSTYLITNLLGQPLLSGPLTNHPINISSLPNGMYFLTIGPHTVKIIKQ